ncbi:hypothetical protein QM012_005530 [Aureobasidium pullulans]|uniref:Uncharacterized protein n=1 Tax=Aureobasidium pullulans TaxID=5580 RepID=A0ABR0T5S9_AURPU
MAKRRVCHAQQQERQGQEEQQQPREEQQQPQQNYQPTIDNAHPIDTSSKRKSVFVDGNKQSKRQANQWHTNSEAPLQPPNHAATPQLYESGSELIEKMSTSGRYTECDLQRIISQAVESPYLYASAIHPSARILGNCILVPSVPIYIFNMLQSLLPSNPRTVRWKLEYKPCPRRAEPGLSSCIVRKRGRLIITMPSTIHDAFNQFTVDIANQLFESHFLPPEYERGDITQSGSAAVQIGPLKLHPDASLAFFDVKNPFLVLEVAYTQTEKAVQRKAQTYILDSKRKIKIVVLIIVAQKQLKKSKDESRPSTSPLDNKNLSAETDTVHVHVYKSHMQGPKKHTGLHVVQRVQVFPGPEPSETFDIAWSDINCGPWSEFCARAHLPPDASEPVCKINLRNLNSIAWNLVGQSEDSVADIRRYRPMAGAYRTPSPTQGVEFMDSSSPQPQLSSGSSGPSDEGRRMDPDYEASERSWGSDSA